MGESKSQKPGWTRVCFGDVVRLNRDRCATPETDGIERYVGLEHIEPEDLRVRRWGLVAEGTTFTNFFRPGQVLFGKRRAYQRKVAVADFAGVCSSDIYVFEPKDPDVLLPDLLPFICQTEGFFDHAVGTSAGSLSPRTNWKQLANYEFALPPLAEQRRIASVLGAVEESLNATCVLEEKLDDLRRSILVDTFTRIMDDPDTRIVKMNQAGDVQMGRQRSPKYDGGLSPRPYLRVANVYDGYIDTNDVKSMDFSDSEFEQYQLREGDILLNEGQSRELVGRSSIFKNEVSNCCYQNTLLRFRADCASPEYAHHYFQYCLYIGRFAAISKQTTSIAHLGATRFSAMPFPVVPSNVERRIVERIAKIRINLNNTSKRRGRLTEMIWVYSKWVERQAASRA